MPPPARASSAPGFQQQQNTFGPPPLQPQLTGYNQPQQTGYGQQYPQQTGFQQGGFQQQGFQQPNGFAQQPQQTGIQAMQQNYPALQPQPTGMAFQPQSQFGQAAQQHHYGPQPGQPQQQYQQQLINGAQTGSPFADPTPRGFAPQPTGFGPPPQQQQTGFGGQPQQPQFNISQPTGAGMNGSFGQPAPQLPPQQTGGVLSAAAPLVPQKTGPAPPVRFGVQGGQKGLVPQPTGRADLSRASKYTAAPVRGGFGRRYADVFNSAAESVWVLKQTPTGIQVIRIKHVMAATKEHTCSLPACQVISWRSNIMLGAEAFICNLPTANWTVAGEGLPLD